MWRGCTGQCEGCTGQCIVCSGQCGGGVQDSVEYVLAVWRGCTGQCGGHTGQCIVAGPKRGRPCRGFSIPVCLWVGVCMCVCLPVLPFIKLQGLSLALRSHDQFQASHWMTDDG